ncbi:hypothetical protein F5887DRAFT_1064070 [Amanita rubescens]|nr:hypothetical protein F5887DRAFT_1064070 [Amanita rubescens]
MGCSSRQFNDDIKFRRFRRQLLQSSLATILSSIRPGMTTPEVIRCPDGHFRRALYILGPYMADYPEQAAIASIVNGWCPKQVNSILLPHLSDSDRCTVEDLGSGVPGGRRACQHTEYLMQACELGELWDDYGLVGDVEPFTNEFPNTDIHELMAPDLLHQVIKGVFKDHLVTWVERYLNTVKTPAQAKKILDEIDYRISLAPPFTGLRRFPIGRGFKQWTGNDSKALMKVYLNAIKGLVPPEIVRTFRAFLEFCYIARQEFITEEALDKLEDALDRFHEYRTIFETSGVRPDGFHLPRQHAMCQHIRSVKEPWRRSNHNNPLGQILVINTRTCKLVSAGNNFKGRGMLAAHVVKGGKLLTMIPSFEGLRFYQDDGDPVTNGGNNEAQQLDPEETVDKLIVDGPSVPTHVELRKKKDRLVNDADQPNLKSLILQFLQEEMDIEEVDPEDIHQSFAIFNSAVLAIVHAPSDPSGIGGMRREFIRATHSWRKGAPRFDCMLYKGNTANPRDMHNLQVVRARLFFWFGYKNQLYSCALVHWFKTLEDEPDDETGMWKIEPIYAADVAVRDLVRAVHILPVFDSSFTEKDLTFNQTLDKFKLFYVNKFIDNNSFWLVS